jgi:hypothetical protein
MQAYSMIPRPLYSPARLPSPPVAVADPVWEPQADAPTDPTPRTGFVTMADMLFWLGVEASPNSLANVKATFRRSAMRARVYDVQEAVDAMVDRLLGLELENSKFTSIDHAVRSVIAFSKKCVSKNGDWILPCIAFRKATRPSRSLKKPVSDPRAQADPARIVEACENRPGMLEILVGTGADRLPTGAIVEIAGGDSYCRSHYGRRQGRAVQYAPCSVRE